MRTPLSMRRRRIALSVALGSVSLAPSLPSFGRSHTATHLALFVAQIFTYNVNPETTLEELIERLGTDSAM